MASFTLEGTIFFKAIGVGAWGIRDDKNREWRPVEMPEQLKSEGARVSVRAKRVTEDFSIHMWGEPIEIKTFHTLNPA